MISDSKTETDLNKSLSSAELIEAALQEKDGDVRWEYVQALHMRGEREIFEQAVRLCQSKDSTKAILGADILGQLGTPNFPFHKESVPVLLKLIGNQQDESALQAATMALGRTGDSRALEKLIELKNHSSEEVRFAVVHGLLTLEDEKSIQALIELSVDEDEDVRNWATFGLGSQIEVNTKEIRDSLFKRLDEEDDEIRGEALVGLSIRKDKRVLDPLLKELASEWVGVLVVEAAGELGDQKLCRSLKDLEAWWDIDKDLLKSAITACCPKQLNETENS